MPGAQFIQNLMAKTRTKYGGTVEVGGKAFAMTTRSLEPRERELLPQDLENAADADLRVFCVAPSDFPIWPALDTALTWQSIQYSLIAVRPGDDVVGSIPMKLEFFVYRTPELDDVGDNTPVEQEAADAAVGIPDAPGALVVPKRPSFRPKSTNTDNR